MARKRTSTFGSVRKLRSGRQQACYWHEGKRHIADHTFDTKADAAAWLATIRTDIGRGGWIDPQAGRVTVAELGKEWLEGDPSKRRRSMIRDEQILRLHIGPTLGSVPIASVTKARVQRLVNAWVAAEQAPRTVHRQYATLHALFAYAVGNDLIGRSPCRGIKLPEVPPLRRTPVTPEAVALLVEAVDVVYQAMVWVGAVLGLRWGEVAGLRVQDLDLLGRTLTVDFQLDEQRELVEVKSGAGRRTLTMPRALVDVLSVHLARAGLTAANGDSLIFTAADGGPLSYTNWRRRTWLPAIEKAGLPDVDFHDLRRAAATALVRLGVDVKTAQTRLGHSDVRLTLEVYAQATTEGDLEAADRLGERFFALQPAEPTRKLHRQK